MMKNKGFSLIEILIVVVIMLVGILSGIMLIAQSHRQLQVAKERSLATWTASSNFAIIKSLPMDALPGWLEKNQLKFKDPLNVNNDDYLSWSATMELIGQEIKTYRVTMSIQMADGRSEVFVSIVTDKGGVLAKPDQVNENK